MNVLIVYGTTEGQTRKIAEWTATRIRERGHQAELLDSAAPVSDLDFATYDAFIIAASVHQEYHQETITSLVIAHLGVLDTKPSAFIPSVYRRYWMRKRKLKSTWIALSL